MIWIPLIGAVAACAVSLSLTAYVISVSHRLRLYDQPDHRKVHRQATPRLGGVGIIGAALLVGVPLFACLVDPSTEGGWVELKHYSALAIGALFVFVMGVLDDLWEVSSRLKLITLLAASCVFCASGAGLGEVVYDFQAAIRFPWLSWILTAAWITGMAVAFNFIDGLDGLSGGLALMAFGVLAYFQLDAHHYAAAVAPLVMAGAIAGFLHFNRPPARTFMGDGGSLTIGYLIGAMTIAANAEPRPGTMRAMVVPSLAMSVALVDTALTLFRRRYEQRRSLFTAERGHIHHRLLDRGLHPRQAVLLIHAVSAMAVAIGVCSLPLVGWSTLGGLALVVPLLWGLFHAAGSVRTTQMISAIRSKREIDRDSRRHRNACEALQLEFDSAKTFSEWWQTVCDAAEQLRFARIEMPIAKAMNGEPMTFRWVNAEGDGEMEDVGRSIDAKLPICTDAEVTNFAEVRVPVGSSLESASERLALFSRLMSDSGCAALRRIQRMEEPPCHAIAAQPRGEFSDLRVAVVHDFFYTYAGAERVVEQIIRVVPQCDVFGLFDFVPDESRGFLCSKPVSTTFLQRMPLARTKHRAYLPLMPLAIEQLDVSDYDLVISSSYLAAKGVITGPDQTHVCYCHSPARYAWDLQHQYLREAGLGFGPQGILARTILHYLRNWDVRTALGVDHFLANSRFVARRISKFYRREAVVIHPPVDVDTFVPSVDVRDDYYLTASRLVGYKKIDVIIEAFNRTPDRRLIVIGDGPERRRLERLAGSNVVLRGQLGKASLVRHLQRARAFVFAAEEDFGIAPVEAMACGTPVIAFRKGGVTESLEEGKAGIFYDEQSADSLLEAIERFESQGPLNEIDRIATRRRAEQFSNDAFVEHLTSFLREVTGNGHRRAGASRRLEDRLPRAIESRHCSTEDVGQTLPEAPGELPPIDDVFPGTDQ
ncbi:glycosyltransferase [Botrimarina mediterranea]|uniref:WbaZ-like glycosyltransferase n=1 Tax=Botrimarina mediterranea TaxID=2528022 RepID=A0A518KA43_9BACT|nr:glycosyltransferase [Botrimarina mediterranea]QDV74667.1 WbaZ-like glycosyltransferase [Botrimarina mediterranea]QDV79304.1 WbaZ-like glycosyltransferase [Planctomycetes bacterium K2D]